MKALFAAALLASACLTPPRPSTGPTPDPEPTEEPAPPPPSEPCEAAWAVQADAECPPAVGHDAWMQRCAALPTSILDCVMRVDSCAYMRACLEQP